MNVKPSLPPLIFFPLFKSRTYYVEEALAGIYCVEQLINIVLKSNENIKKLYINHITYTKFYYKHIVSKALVTVKVNVQIWNLVALQNTFLTLILSHNALSLTNMLSTNLSAFFLRNAKNKVLKWDLFVLAAVTFQHLFKVCHIPVSHEK